MEFNSDFYSNRLLRIYDIIGDPARGILPLLPVSRSHFYAFVKAGIYPQPVKLGLRSVTWRASDIFNLIASLTGKAQGERK